MNRLGVLPRGFGTFPVLEVLDLTYNNLDESTLPGNFFMMGKTDFLLLELYAYASYKAVGTLKCTSVTHDWIH
jgi:hypothetical protein